MDIRGHGRTHNPENYLDLELMSRDVLSLTEEIEMERPVIFGYSLGGYIGLYMLSKYDPAISGLICHEVKYEWTPSFAEKMSKLFDPELIEKKNPKWAEKLEKIHIHGWKKLAKEVMEFVKAMAYNRLNDSDLEKIRCPVMVSAGDRSELVTLEEAIYVYRAIPDSCFFVTPFAKHGINTLPIDIYIQMIEKFIQSLK